MYVRVQFITVGLVAIGLAVWSGPGTTKDIVVHAGTLLDGVTETLRKEVSVLIHDDRITAVQGGYISPPGAEVVDLSRATVMPGFIDVHVHISSRLPIVRRVSEIG